MALCRLFFLVSAVCATAFAGTSVRTQTTGDYEALVKLHEDFVSTREPSATAGFPDYTPPAVATMKRRLGELRRRLAAIEPDNWPVSQKVDYLFVHAEMNQLDFRLSVTRPWERDPGLYVDLIARVPPVPSQRDNEGGDAAAVPAARAAARGAALAAGRGRAGMSPGPRNFPIPTERITDLQTRLQAVPKLIEQAKGNLTRASGELARMAVRDLERSEGLNQHRAAVPLPKEGIIGWYAYAVEQVAKHHPELLLDSQRALAAAEGYRDWLKTNEPRMKEPAGIGLDKYSWYMKNVQMMPFTAADSMLMAERERGRALAFLTIERHRNRNLPPFDPVDTREDYTRLIRGTEEWARTFITQHDILTIPADFPRMGMREASWRLAPDGSRDLPQWLNDRDPLMLFLHGQIPGHGFDRVVPRSHRIRPTVPIEYFDHVRGDGWAFYVEEMLLQAGIADQRPRSKELFYLMQLQRALRIPAEHRMHSREFTVEDAVAFMRREFPLMDERSARAELLNFMRQPTHGQMYVMGKVQMEQLLADRAQQLGEKFHLGRFHDEFLAAGLVPISLIRWEMTGLDDQIKEIWQQARRGAARSE